MEVNLDLDLSDPLGNPNIAKGTKNWVCTRYKKTTLKVFLDNDFKCDNCVPLWFKNDLKTTNINILA